jgi:hypothetical protein
MLNAFLEDPLARAFLIPVVAAVLTTGVVEYFAKPVLEARKARLLRDRQQFDEVVFAFQKLVLLMAAMLDDATARKSAELAAVQKQQAADATQASQELIAAMSRLPSAWVERHHAHVSRTVHYVGFVRGILVSGSSKLAPSMDYARSLSAGLSCFDSYFVAFATLRDSQPAWYKRSFSRRFMRSDYEHDALMALREAGLPDPVPDAS